MHEAEVPLFERMWCTRQATAWTGQSQGLLVLLWWMTWPIVPFFWFVIFNVTSSAVNSMCRGELWGRIFPFFQNPMSPMRNSTVRFAFFLGLLVRKSRAGRVYSPICSRKKNVMIARSPTAWSRGLLLCCAVANMWIGTDTGMASWGTAGGSFNLLLRDVISAIVLVLPASCAFSAFALWTCRRMASAQSR